MTEKVLFVDDDPNILASYRRQLRKKFPIETALGGQQGLDILGANGPFAVVVADMRMPGMDGIQFLAAVRASAPDTVRMMLTGNADLQTAVDAVNEGNIFRFLTKPCTQETLTRSLMAGIKQYRLVTAERELLQKTLTGSVKVLTEILSLVNPTAFSRASRIRRYVRHIALQLNLPELWQYELAAMLSQIGCVTLPSDIIDKIYAQQPLSEDERAMFASHPAVGRNLLDNIPRLEMIACMIENQQKPFKDYTRVDDISRQSTIALGAQMIKVALDFDQYVVSGFTPRVAIQKLFAQRDQYNPQMVAALAKLQAEEVEREAVVRQVAVADLRVGMIVDEDIRTETGLLLVAKGQEVTYPVLMRLRNFSKEVGVKEPIRVKERCAVCV